MRGLLALAMLGLVVWPPLCVGAAGQRQVTAQDVWVYIPFDGSLDSLVPTFGLRVVDFGSAQDQTPSFAQGVHGQAFRVARSQETRLSYEYGLRDFPAERGSLLMWFRPTAPLADDPERHTLWLMDAVWAAFDLTIQGTRLYFYATTNPGHSVRGDLARFEKDWGGNWHCVVGTWEGASRRLYFDGELVGERDDVEGLSVPHGFRLGFRGPPLDWDMDEFAILKAPLSAGEVRALFENGKRGLLAALGGDVRCTLARAACVRGERARLRVVPYAAGDAIRVTALPESGGPGRHIALLPCEPSEVDLDTATLRPGRYRLRLEVLRNGKVAVSDESTRIGVNPTRTPEFPVGIDGLRGYPDSLLELMQDWRISLTSNGGFYDIAGFHRDLDRLYRHGIGLQPCLNIHWHRALMPYVEDPDLYFDKEVGDVNERGKHELIQVLRYDDGEWRTTSIGSPFSKVGRRAMLARVEAVVRAARGHPGLHSLAFDDEYDLRVGGPDDTGRRWYGDYSDAAVAHFKEQSGLASFVMPPREPRGTILPDDHPYFQWRDIIGMPGDCTTAGLRLNNSEQTALVHQLRPDVLTTTWSGGEYGECDAVMDYTYPVIWQPHPGYQAGQARLDFTFDRHRARQRVAPLKPVWGLTGWWSHDLNGQPDWCVDDFRLSTIMTLAKGAKLILWFTTYPRDTAPPGALGAGLLSRKDLADEVHRWSEWIHRYGGMFARLEARPSHRVAVLFSEANRAGQVATVNNPFSFDRFYPAMRIAGLPVDLITDERVRDGTLDRYEALCLFGIHYTTPSLWQRIGDFARTPGKIVICDQSTAPALRPERSLLLSVGVLQDLARQPGQTNMENKVDTIARNAVITREEVLPRLIPDDLQLVGSDLVAPHWLHGGEGRLLALVNYNLYRTESVSVSLTNSGGVVYDLLTQKVVAEAQPGQPLQWNADNIGEADWRLFLLLPRKIARVAAAARFAAGKFSVTARVEGDGGKALKAAIPVRLQFFQPDGREAAEYETYTATNSDSGAASVSFPRAALMDEAGTWKVVVTELVSGHAAAQTIRVSQ